MKEYMKDNDVTILVNSCDDYNDVRSIFKKSLEEYWPNCPYQIVYNYESSPLINLKEKEKRTITWGERLIRTLNKINTKYVITLFDDFLLEEKVDINKIQSALHEMKSNNISVIYLNATCTNHHLTYKNNNYCIIRNNVDYRLNSSPALWEKSELEKFTGANDNPWAWELFGSYRTNKNSKLFISVKSHDEDIFKYNFSKGGGIYRGKWVKEVVEEKIIKYKLNINLKERGVVNFNESLKRSLKWKINFILIGYSMIGWRMLLFVKNFIIKKITGYEEVI